MSNKKSIQVSASIDAPLERVWEYWTSPSHIVNWNSPSDDWHTPKAENELEKGGRFVYRMEAKDGSVGFDFGGTYEEISEQEKLVYVLDDDRRATVTFKEKEGGVLVSESFEPEDQNSEEMQQQGWQAILDNFMKYVESN
ncbi:MAG: hypothetical protein CMC35_08640 [Flavobacteriaceae bacterium]|nr:hypothetical protein [Flavobacteriaceae bacterium]|tara:strand:- start:31599 stop:32018 length:420 start_codon:yes stop_codon:yes gene_type:complete